MLASLSECDNNILYNIQYYITMFTHEISRLSWTFYHTKQQHLLQQTS